VFNALLPTIRVNNEEMRNAVNAGFATATYLAEYLVGKGTPFRDAHEAVGEAVRFCIDNDIQLSELSLGQLQEFSAVIENDVFSVLTVEGSIHARNHVGGTAPDQVRAAISRARERLAISSLTG